MRLLAFVLLFVVTTAQAQWTFDNSPYRKFNAAKNTAETVTITWRYVEAKHIQAACEAESRRIGNNGYAYAVEACTFMLPDRCTIITSRVVDMRLMGHEMLHCFQGDWHDQPSK